MGKGVAMHDLLFLSLTVIFFLATLGLLLIAEHLMR
jgi:hypothetical protein